EEGCRVGQAGSGCCSCGSCRSSRREPGAVHRQGRGPRPPLGTQRLQRHPGDLAGLRTGAERCGDPGRSDLALREQQVPLRDPRLGWGARTVSSDPSWRYINVRRLFLMIEQSIEIGTQWVVFEPNDETLWKRVTRNITAFLLRIYNSGALMGKTPEEAFYVKCDSETNPPEVVDAGQMVCEIGIAPVKPAEFVIFRIGQMAGQSK